MGVSSLLVIFYLPYTVMTILNSRLSVIRALQTKQIIQFDDVGKPLYSENSSRKYITENRGHDILIADWEVRVVVVVDQAGKHWASLNYKEQTI